MEDNVKPIVIDVRNARAGEARAALERLALVTGDPAYHRAARALMHQPSGRPPKRDARLIEEATVLLASGKARSRGPRICRSDGAPVGPGSVILCLGLILESLRLPNPAWPSKRRGACCIVACGRAPLRNGVAVDTRPLSSQAEGAPLRARQALRAIFRLRMGARCCSA